MAVLVLTAVLVVLLIAVLSFTRGGAREVATVNAAPAPFPRVELADLGDVTERLLGSLGFRIEKREPDDGRGPGYVATTGDGIAGGRVYVRAFSLPAGERVRSQDVQAAILTARDEGMSKAILIAPNGFSDEAILAAEDTATELIDGPKLEMLLRDQRTS